MERLDYTKASDRERIHSIFAGDPVGDYYGFEEIQIKLLADEKIEAIGKLLVNDQTIQKELLNV